MRPLVLLAIFTLSLAPAFASEAPMIAEFKQQLATATARLAEKPDDIPTLSKAGDLHLFLLEYPQAVAAFEKTIALDPAQDAPHWRLGIAYYFAGQYEKSARQFAKYHAYDARDRENGVWKFLADARLSGVEKARSGMLEYTRFDREPFPALYEMLAGKRTPESVMEHAATPALAGDPQVQFFAHYYVGLMKDLTGDRAAAVDHLTKAVAIFTPATAQGGGPGYMWQVARLHLAELSKPAAPATPRP
jgi:tetratricopeptide (TPR) repeat protein